MAVDADGLPAWQGFGDEEPEIDFAGCKACLDPDHATADCTADVLLSLDDIDVSTTSTSEHSPDMPHDRSTMPEHVSEPIDAPDHPALGDLIEWCDDDRLAEAQAVLDNGVPASEVERTTLAFNLGDEVQQIGVALAQLRMLTDQWCAITHPSPSEHRAGMAALRAVEYEMVASKLLYQRAVTALKMTLERKAARSVLLDRALGCVYGDNDYGDLCDAAETFKQLHPTKAVTA